MGNNSVSEAVEQPARETAEIRARVERCVLDALDNYARDEAVTRSDAVRVILADWLRTHGYKINSSVRPEGRATDVVATMDAAIKAHRASRNRKSGA